MGLKLYMYEEETIYFFRLKSDQNGIETLQCNNPERGLFRLKSDQNGIETFPGLGIPPEEQG